jgi:hypothetical protein
MTNELPHPEKDRSPERGLFNLVIMTDDQIVLVGRALDGEHERSCTEAGAFLCDAFVRDIGELVRQDPDRGKGLLMRMARSEDNSDRSFAAESTPVLAELDYELARDILLYIASRPPTGDSYESCFDASYVFPRHITPEQAADFAARWAAAQTRPLQPPSWVQ